MVAPCASATSRASVTASERPVCGTSRTRRRAAVGAVRRPEPVDRRVVPVQHERMADVEELDRAALNHRGAVRWDDAGADGREVGTDAGDRERGLVDRALLHADHAGSDALLAKLAREPGVTDDRTSRTDLAQLEKKVRRVLVASVRRPALKGTAHAA